MTNDADHPPAADPRPPVGDDRPDVGAHRVHGHPVLGPLAERRAVGFTFDGRPLEGYEGEPIAAALLAHGVRTLRSARSGAPRGAYCFIGHCFECRVTVDVLTHERACLTPLRAGMDVRRGDV